MKALILAAGEGTRLRPLTETRPKPMLPLGGRPILEHLVGYLREYGIGDIAINLHYKPGSIVDYFADGSDFGVSITYSHEQRLLGSAGAAKALEWYFDAEPFFVLYGDVLSDVDLDKLWTTHRSTGAMATLALHRVPDPWRCGIVQLEPDGRISRFIEKPARDLDCGNLANSGIYVVDPRLLHWVPAAEAFDFGTDLFPQVIEMGMPLFGVATDAYVLDIGSPERYAQAQRDLESGRYRSNIRVDGGVAEVAARC